MRSSRQNLGNSLVAFLDEAAFEQFMGNPVGLSDEAAKHRQFHLDSHSMEQSTSGSRQSSEARAPLPLLVGWLPSSSQGSATGSLG